MNALRMISLSALVAVGMIALAATSPSQENERNRLRVEALSQIAEGEKQLRSTVATSLSGDDLLRAATSLPNGLHDEQARSAFVEVLVKALNLAHDGNKYLNALESARLKAIDGTPLADDPSNTPLVQTLARAAVGFGDAIKQTALARRAERSADAEVKQAKIAQMKLSKALSDLK